MMRSILITLYSSFLILFLQIAGNGQIIIKALKDNSIYQDNDNSNGQGEFLVAGQTAKAFNRRALIAFKIDVLNPEEVDSVHLILTTERSISSNLTFKLHKLLKDWGEGTSAIYPPGEGVTATPGDVTWNTTFYPTTPWTTPGGDFEAIPSASYQTDGGITVIIKGLGLTTDVKRWISDPTTNFGWIIIGNENQTASAMRIHSREKPGRDFPKLLIYTKTITNLSKENSTDIPAIYYSPNNNSIVIQNCNEPFVTIYNVSGKVLSYGNFSSINTTGFQKGIYFIKLESEGKINTQKVQIF